MSKGWQPIETAPKGGTILVKTSDGRVATAHWHNNAAGGGYWRVMSDDPMLPNAGMRDFAAQWIDKSELR
jgi:hypothetical protein